MLHYVLPGQRAQYSDLIEAYFRLRKRIFCDKLGWVEARPDGLEADRFDTMFNVFILCTDPESGELAGGVRLMPTTGPTLLHSVWSHMLPSGDEFRSPSIWEATRFCVDEEISSRKRNLLNRTTLSLSIGVADFAQANGISHVIAICERYFFDMAAVYGNQAEIVSTEVDGNGLEISCGLWSTGKIAATLEWGRMMTGNREPAILKQVA